MKLQFTDISSNGRHSGDRDFSGLKSRSPVVMGATDITCISNTIEKTNNTLVNVYVDLVVFMRIAGTS